MACIGKHRGMDKSIHPRPIQAPIFACRYASRGVWAADASKPYFDTSILPSFPTS